jgi:hypothetical protein
MSEWFDNPRMCDAIAYDLILADHPRGQNRARIANLANGAPPYSQQEVKENNISVNVSDLTHTRMLHDARSQYSNAFLKSGYFARLRTDLGPAHKRDRRNLIVTKEWNKRLKTSISYFERLRASFGNLVLHGISPAVWERADDWQPVPIGVEDVLLPGETLLGFKNLPFLVVRRSFTAIELYKLTVAEKRDPGWNMPFVKRLLDWMNEQASQLRALNWPDVWAPEKIQERMKSESGGTLAGDRAPKIDVFDIYAYENTKDHEGWIRRMILDSWSDPVMAGGSVSFSRKDGVDGDTNNFLFTSRSKLVANNWNEIISFQFANLSAVFPARYHSVRSLGWLLYAACHLGNRLRCKFYESVLEALMMLYEVDSQNDVQNALKLNLINRGFIDKTIRPVKAQDRWQVNAALVELGLQDNAKVISENATAYAPSRNYSQDQIEKTRFQVVAELQSATSLVSTALNQAYHYQAFEFKEIWRRYCRKNSTDPDVRAFRAACLRQDVPEYLLNDAGAWEVEPERVMGGGNKSLEMQIADWLMSNRPAFDPESQQKILRKATLAYTDDAEFTLDLVPEEPLRATHNMREGEHIAADLLAGIQVEPLTGENHMEIIERLLRILGERVQRGLQSGGMVEAKELMGLQGIGNHIAARIELLADDPQQKQRVKEYGDILGSFMNHVKAFGQRLQQAMQAQMKQQGGNGQQGPDPRDQAKAQAMIMQAETKNQLATKSHGVRTAQKQVQHEMKLRQQAEDNALKMRQQEQEHALKLRMEMRQHHADLAATDLDAASKVRRNKLKATEED